LQAKYIAQWASLHSGLNKTESIQGQHTQHISGMLVYVEFRVRFVRLSVCNDEVLCKNVKFDRDAVCGGRSGRSN